MKKYSLFIVFLLYFNSVLRADKYLYYEIDDYYTEVANIVYNSIKNQIGTISIRKVNVDTAILFSVPNTIQFVLEDSLITLNKKVLKIEKENNYLYASFTNNETNMFISLLDDNLIAEIQSTMGTYRIVTLSKNEYALVNIDISEIQFEPNILKSDNSANSPNNIYEDINESTRLNEDTSVIRILVLYTDSAGKLISNTLSSTAIKNHVFFDINKANESFTNSDIQAKFELAYIGKTSGGEGILSFEDILDKFIATSDGYIDEVHSLRNKYKADVCVLLVNSSAYCGLSYLKASSSKAFSVVYAASGCSLKYTFVHEIGHLLGCNHDRNVESSNWPYKYGHGFVHYVPGSTTASWRTIMAYSDVCGGNSNCSRIPYWSNPNISYNGIATGTTTYENNARVWNERASTVNNFRTKDNSINITSANINTNALYESYEASTNILIGSGYEVQSGQVVDIVAGTEIRITANTHIKSGSKFRASIRNNADESNYPQFIAQKELFNSDSDIHITFSINKNHINNHIAINSIQQLQSIRIYNITGQCVMQTRQTDIDTSNLPAGVYIITANTTTGETLQNKFINY